MNSLIIENLSVAILNNDMRTVYEIFLKNFKLLNRPESVNLILAQAIRYNIEEKTIEILMEHGSKMNFNQLLVLSVTIGNLRLAKLLLRNGVKPEVVLQKKNNYPLRRIFQSTPNFRKEMLQLLIDYGLKIKDIQNKYGENVLHQFIYFVEKNDEDVVEVAEIIVNSGVPFDEPDIDDCTALHCSTLHGNKDLVSFLIEKGAGVNRRAYSSELFPLLVAASCGHKKIIDLLLSNSADINAQSKVGWTALHVACLEHLEPIISLLIRRGADISAVKGDGYTPFALLEPDNWKLSDHRRGDCIVTMVKEFAKLIFENLLGTKSKSDLKMIMNNPNTRQHYENCLSELHQTAIVKFYEPYSYYSVLKKSKNVKKIALLTKNNEYVLNFEKNLDRFFYYQSDLGRILEEAIQVRNELSTVESRLVSIFGDIFPDIVIRNLQNYLSVADLPLE